MKEIKKCPDCGEDMLPPFVEFGHISSKWEKLWLCLKCNKYLKDGQMLKEPYPSNE